MLPKWLRDEVWRTYRPGQEITKDPSREYVEVIMQVQEWIAEYQKTNIEKVKRT